MKFDPEDVDIEAVRRAGARRLVRGFIRQVFLFVAAVTVYAVVVGIGHGSNVLDVAHPLQLSYVVILGVIWFVAALAIRTRKIVRRPFRPADTPSFEIPVPKSAPASEEPAASEETAAASSEPQAAAPETVPVPVSAAPVAVARAEAAQPVRLSLRAAEEGDLAAMRHVADIAWVQGRVLDAYYWLTCAELSGMTGLETALERCRGLLLDGSEEAEEADLSATLDDAQVDFAHAAIDFESGYGRFDAHNYLRERAAAGDALSALFLERRLARGLRTPPRQRGTVRRTPTNPPSKSV